MTRLAEIKYRVVVSGRDGKGGGKVSDVYVDLTKIPVVLRSLPWQERQEFDQFFDGDLVLAAVPVSGVGSKRTTPADEWHYELHVLSVECDEDHFAVTLDGEPFGWEWSDVAMFVRLDPPPPSNGHPPAWLDCRPYRRMADRIVEACIESRDYDELYRRCMDAIDEAEPGMRENIEAEHVRKMVRIMRGESPS